MPKPTKARGASTTATGTATLTIAVTDHENELNQTVVSRYRGEHPFLSRLAPRIAPFLEVRPPKAVSQILDSPIFYREPERCWKNVRNPLRIDRPRQPNCLEVFENMCDQPVFGILSSQDMTHNLNESLQISHAPAGKAPNSPSSNAQAQVQFRSIRDDSCQRHDSLVRQCKIVSQREGPPVKTSDSVTVDPVNHFAASLSSWSCCQLSLCLLCPPVALQ